MEQYTLKQLQTIELQILIDFDQFCRTHNLQYYLIGGALLGATRYGKFIPWDDDVDVAMPREDYERLKQIYQADRYFLQNAESDPKFSRCIQKVRLNGTTIVERVCENVDIHQGIYIDIFPVDYVADICPKKMSRRAMKIRRLMSLRTIKGGYNNGRYSSIKKLIQVLLPVSVTAIDKYLDMLCTAENALERNYAVLWLHNYSWDKQTHKMETLGRNGVCCFCGHEFYAPADTDAFLRSVFGEHYMEEPAPEKQICPHNYLNVSVGVGDLEK